LFSDYSGTLLQGSHDDHSSIASFHDETEGAAGAWDFPPNILSSRIQIGTKNLSKVFSGVNQQILLVRGRICLNPRGAKLP
jgi:hypothetical protein